MAIDYHPQQGAILICDFDGMKTPEIIKRRPVIVISPRFRNRGKLCTIVPLSTTAPRTIEKYHYQIELCPSLPKPYDEPLKWAKCDMIYTVSFERLFKPFIGKDDKGNRIYDERIIDKAELEKIQECVKHGLGLITS